MPTPFNAPMNLFHQSAEIPRWVRDLLLAAGDEIAASRRLLEDRFAGSTDSGTVEVFVYPRVMDAFQLSTSQTDALFAKLPIEDTPRREALLNLASFTAGVLVMNLQDAVGETLRASL